MACCLMASKANLKDFIAATGLVIILKLDSNFRWMNSKNNRAIPLCYVKLCALFQSHQWIQTGVTGWKCSIWIKIGNISSRVTLKFDGWSKKTIGHLFYAPSSFSHHFVAICKFKLELQSGIAQIGAKFALTSVSLTFDLWPWLFAWTSLSSMVIMPENFMMIWWEEIVKKVWQTDGQTVGHVLKLSCQHTGACTKWPIFRRWYFFF